MMSEVRNRGKGRNSYSNPVRYGIDDVMVLAWRHRDGDWAVVCGSRIFSSSWIGNVFLYSTTQQLRLLVSVLALFSAEPRD